MSKHPDKQDQDIVVPKHQTTGITKKVNLERYDVELILDPTEEAAALHFNLNEVYKLSWTDNRRKGNFQYHYKAWVTHDRKKGKVVRKYEVRAAKIINGQRTLTTERIISKINGHDIPLKN